MCDTWKFHIESYFESDCGLVMWQQKIAEGCMTSRGIIVLWSIMLIWRAGV
jgi:hypothetical protein